VAAELPLTPVAEPWLTLPVAEEPVALVERTRQCLGAADSGACRVRP
jgi:hypothetical protein